MTPHARTLRQRLLSLDLDALTDRELTAVAVAMIALLSTLAWVLLSTVMPAPPKSMAITSGPTSGAYHQRALRLAAAMRQDGVVVHVASSRGTPENLERLRSGNTQAGFVQGGIADLSTMHEIESLARFGHEPVWVFRRRGVHAQTLADLKGLRVSIGMPGSGTRPVAQALLRAAGISELNTSFAEYGNDEALEALGAGRIDVFFAVAAWDAPVIQRAFREGHRFLGFAQAAALSRQFPWLTAVVLPRGSLSLERDEPPADVPLVAVSTELVVRSALHPATKALLLRSALEDQRTALATPLMRAMSLAPMETLSDDAQGESSFLHKHLPFWWAELLHRLSLTVLPVLLVALPALKAAINFRDRRSHLHILRLFAHAKELQLRSLHEPLKGGQAENELRRLEAELRSLSPRAVHLVDYYRLRSTLAAMNGSARSRPLEMVRRKAALSEG